MKKIEEQWKTIEEFPDYAISNFGRCKHIKSKKLLCSGFRQSGSSCYDFHIREGDVKKTFRRTRGILVARAFVANPDGCKNIRYLDGDPSNAIFTNIQWTTVNYYKFERHKTPFIPREEQLKNMRTKMEMAERFEKALINGTEQEFVYGELKDLCKKIVYGKFPGFNDYLKEEIINNVIDRIYSTIKRGSAILHFEYTIKMRIFDFCKKNKEQLKTVEFDERRM
jgi:hypothetical protein